VCVDHEIQRRAYTLATRQRAVVDHRVAHAGVGSGGARHDRGIAYLASGRRPVRRIRAPGARGRPAADGHEPVVPLPDPGPRPPLHAGEGRRTGRARTPGSAAADRGAGCRDRGDGDADLGRRRCDRRRGAAVPVPDLDRQAHCRSRHCACNSSHAGGRTGPCRAGHCELDGSGRAAGRIGAGDLARSSAGRSSARTGMASVSGSDADADRNSTGVGVTMYRYTEFDQRMVDERVAQYRDQVARYRRGELTDDEFRPLRLRNGLYIQRHAPMLRVAIPYGLLSSRQMRMLAHVARPWDRGYGHFTTRQNIQFNWPRLEDSPDILQALATVQMHAIQTSGNSVRNITTDPLAGVAPDEQVDPRPYSELVRQWSTFHPEFSWLPRKFKIALTGTLGSDRTAAA